MRKEAFEDVHGKLGDNVTYIDLDDPANQVPAEVVTGGWTDTQIRAKSSQEIDAMINSGQMGLDSLRDTIRKEEQRINNLYLIKQRKLLLGD